MATSLPTSPIGSLRICVKRAKCRAGITITPAAHPRSSLAAHGQFQAPFEWQRHRSEAASFEKYEIVRVFASISFGIVADHDGPRLQIRRNQLERRPRHGNPG